MSAIDWYSRRSVAEDAIQRLAYVRDALISVEAHAAADAVRRAIKSVDGARRHADGRCLRKEREVTP